MKLMIASDIHGSALYCGRLLEAFEKEGAEKLLLLGDLLYHGARNDLPEGYDTKKVTSQLNAVKERLLCVRGNCESEVDQMVLQFPVLGQYALLLWEGRTVFAVHGHEWGPEKLPPLAAGSLLLSGHTHVPHFRREGEIYLANPGSVSLPKEGSARGYLLLSGGALTWKTLEGRILRQETL
ncbi:MAG: phosphodiesterase [Oscillospiraceae bacterium]